MCPCRGSGVFVGDTFRVFFNDKCDLIYLYVLYWMHVTGYDCYGVDGPDGAQDQLPLGSVCVLVTSCIQYFFTTTCSMTSVVLKMYWADSWHNVGIVYGVFILH